MPKKKKKNWQGVWSIETVIWFFFLLQTSHVVKAQKQLNSIHWYGTPPKLLGKQAS